MRRTSNKCMQLIHSHNHSLWSGFCKYNTQPISYIHTTGKHIPQPTLTAKATDKQYEALFNQKKKPNPLTKNAIALLVFSGISFMISAYSVGVDNPEILIAKLDQQMVPIINDSENVEQSLETFAQYTHTNDTLKRKIVDSGYLGNFIKLVKEGKTAEICHLAAKVIDNLAQDDNNKERISMSPQFSELVSIVSNKDESLYVRKTLAHALASCATIEHLHVELAKKGVPSALHKVQQEKLLKRKYFELALRHMASTVLQSNSEDIGGNDIAVLQEVHERYGDQRDSPLAQLQKAVVNSGVSMYLHTSAGGFVWGAIESLRQRESALKILKNSIKTSMVTGLVPICFVGIGVSAYNHYHRLADTAQQRFYLTFATCMSIYPWYYLLPIIERFSPYWIGGHVLGFMSFFTWMILTENDMFKTDTNIKLYDQRKDNKTAKS